MIEQFGKESVVVTTRLPDTSDLDGRITGGVVEFTKTYRGAMETDWIVKGHEVASAQRRRHKVQYSGNLDRDRMCIDGKVDHQAKGAARLGFTARSIGAALSFTRSLEGGTSIRVDQSHVCKYPGASYSLSGLLPDRLIIQSTGRACSGLQRLVITA